jgi:Rps23 Pro-64 3,4-dihydroxylase Tpa1-like proline 4-hydroxylase
VPRPWREFVEELKGERYKRALCRLVGIRHLDLNFHWHYTPNGCSVSPHCDSKRKLGSHIFYFNTEKDWKPEWGGETVILDDRGRFRMRSAPSFDDFDAAESSTALGNHSLIFTRRGNSWHGVREIRCPEGAMRRVFIVVLNRADPFYRLRSKLSGKGFERY